MWTQTYTGARIEFSEFADPESIRLADIAHSLSLLCRYGGHCKLFYSVAEHSIHVMRRVQELIPGNDMAARAALLHDATEAYVGDVPTPLKKQLGEVYREIEEDFQTAIEDRFEVPIWAYHKAVKRADLECLAAEAKQLFDPPPHEDWADGMLEPWSGCFVYGWSPAIAKRRFLSAAEGLGIK